MTPAKINKVLAEIERFVDAAHDALPNPRDQFPSFMELGPSRETGRLRRASMDLSQALTALRRRGDRP